MGSNMRSMERRGVNNTVDSLTKRKNKVSVCNTANVCCLFAGDQIESQDRVVWLELFCNYGANLPGGTGY